LDVDLPWLGDIASARQGKLAQGGLGKAITRRTAIGSFAMSAPLKHNTAQCAALIAPYTGSSTCSQPSLKTVLHFGFENA
jgi:hypothetical protein